ncbi:unnamed protein product [Caenorhabditis sp. 36 PRJEB53466]|nr:unnamed protein product [Caenorhabditis sp. 36 PRJEB53466]
MTENAQNLPRNKNGFLYQHTKLLPYSEKSGAVFKLTGQKFDMNPFNFTAEEEEKIRKNWAKFQKEFKIPADWHICDVIGYPESLKNEKNIEKKPDLPNQKQIRKYLWPLLCDGMPNRMAATVRRIIWRIHNFIPDPEKSVRNLNGFLYQHSMVGKGGQQNIKIRRVGVKLDSDIRTFTEEEDEKIRENWKKCTQKLEIPDDVSIFDVVKSNLLGEDPNEHLPIPNWVEKKKYLWPTLCDGMPNRMAATVRERIRCIFDPNFEGFDEKIEDICTNFEEDDDRRIRKNWKKFRKSHEIRDDLHPFALISLNNSDPHFYESYFEKNSPIENFDEIRSSFLPEMRNKLVNRSEKAVESRIAKCLNLRFFDKNYRADEEEKKLPRDKYGQLRQHSKRSQVLPYGDKDCWNFSREEDERIKQNWRRICEIFAIDRPIFDFVSTEKHSDASLPHPFAERLGFFLCDGLLERNFQTISKRVPYIFDPFYKENDGYNTVELTETLENLHHRGIHSSPEEMRKVSENLKIPLQYVLHYDRKQKWRIRHQRFNFPNDFRFGVLKCMIESVNEKTAGMTMSSFDEDVFKKKLVEYSVDPVSLAGAVRLYHNIYDSKKTFLSHVPANFQQKLMFIYEGLARYTYNVSKTALKNRKKQRPMLRGTTLFSVILEHFRKENKDWQPPEPLRFYMNIVDVPGIMSGISHVEEHRKRRSTESPRITVVAKRVKLEELEEEEEEDRAIRMIDDNRLEISSIDAANRTAKDELTEEQELTNLEISSLDSSAHASADPLLIRPDETILAGGGRDFIMYDPDMPTEERKLQRNELLTTSFQPDDTLDLWAQLTQ